MDKETDRMEKQNIDNIEYKSEATNKLTNTYDDKRYNIPIPIVLPHVKGDLNDLGEFSSFQSQPPPALRRSNTHTYVISTDNEIDSQGNNKELGVVDDDDDEIVSILSSYNPAKSKLYSSTGNDMKSSEVDNKVMKNAEGADLSLSAPPINQDIVEGILCQNLKKLSFENTDNNISQSSGISQSPDTLFPLQSDEEELEEDIPASGNIYIEDTTTTSTPDNLEGNNEEEEDDADRINMYDNTQYNICQQKAYEFEHSDIGDYYKKHFCLKPCTASKCRESTIEKYYSAIREYITNSYDEVLKYNQMRLCVLPKEHEGACNSSPFSEKKMLLQSRVSNKMETSINSCIYQVPGDTSGNSYYKNRASRLYPIVISSDTKIKMKRENSESKIPKICISLKEHTTPFLMATAYIDWVTYAIHIEGMEENMISPLSAPYLGWKNLLMNEHASFLHKHFKDRNRKIFDIKSGVRKTICAVKQNILTVSNFADITRDNRIIIDQNDIQMGHILPRNNNEYTIRGTNLLMMTREGNRAVGENDYMDNSWILRDISILQNLCNPNMDTDMDMK